MEGREIIAKHQEIDASRVLECLRLRGSPLGAQSVVFFLGLCITQAKTLLLAPAENFFPHFAAVGALYLVIARSVIAFTKFRTKFLSSEEPVNQLTNFRFAGRGSMNDFLLLPKFSFPGFPI